MISVKKAFNGVFIIAPIIIGAYLSGIFYLAEGASIPLTVFQIALVIFSVIFVLKKIATKDISFSLYGLEKEYFIFLTIIFFSLIYSVERQQGLFMVTRYIILIGLTYIIYNAIESYNELKILCYVIIGIALIVAIQNLIEIILNPEIATYNYLNQGTKIIRSRGTETDPNIFASNFILPIMLTVSFIGEKKSTKDRMLLFFAVGIMVASVLITYSRSAWLAILTGILIVILYQKNYKIIIYAFFALILIFTASSGVRNIIFSLVERALDIFAGSTEDSSRIRLILFQTAILMWLDSYTFGVGYQSFSTYFKQYYPPQEVIGVYEPHNEFYTVLAELGIIGFLVFIFLIRKILLSGWESIKLYKEKKQSTSIVLALFASYVAYLVFFQFLGGMQYHTILTINIGLLFCARKFVDYKSDTEE